MECFRILFFILSINSIAALPALALEAPQSFPSVSAETLRPLLNSERIKLKFGSYGIDVLHNGKRKRISNLYSVRNKQRTTRTFALVVYPEKTAEPLWNEHNMIIDGGSIGAVFKESGWNIEKKHTFFGEIEASPKLEKIYSLMRCTAPANLAIHVYDLFVSKNGTKYHYATIAEAHHPRYLDANDLRRIYGEEFQRNESITEDIQSILNVVEREAEDI